MEREPEDVEIADIRVLLYNASTGQFVTQDAAQGFGLGETVELELLTGTYDVVFIANASSDTSLTGPGGKFNGVFGNSNNYNTLEKVKNALLDSRAFDEDDTPIPMFALVRDVHISLGGSVQIAGGTPLNTHTTPWEPVLQRAGVRISMEITLSPYHYADWMAATDGEIEISELPVQSWLWESGKFNGGLSARESAARVYTATTADEPTAGYDGYTIHVEADPDAEPEAIEEHYLIRYDRIIVPELLFDDTDDADYAAVLSMDLGDDMVVSGRISGPNPDTSADGYTLPRNLWLHLDVSIAAARLEVIPKVIPWNATAGGGIIGDTNWLRARGPVYIANVWPQTFDAVTNLDNVALLRVGGSPKIEYIDGDDWLTVTETATTTAGTEGSEATETRTVTVKAKTLNTGLYRHARVWVVANDTTTGEKIEKWVEVVNTSGIPVPAGVIGYVASGPDYGKLTLRGSREYATALYNGVPVFRDAALDMLPGEGGLHPETVYAAYFKWGSLVAVSSELTDDSFDRDDIVAAPEDYNNIGYPAPALDAVKALIPDEGGTSLRWGRIPFRDLVDAYDNRWKSEPTRGLGDPCAYYFKDWRLPLGGASNRDDTPVNGWNGGTFGTAEAGGGGQPSEARGVAFAAGDLGPGIPAGRRAGNGTPTYPADWTMFMPYTGARLAAGGDTASQGSSGGYWSSTPRDNSYGGYFLGVQQSTAYPAHAQEYETGFAIRCIDTDPPLPRGVHAAPGTIGYIVEGPNKGTLTLRGSSAFAGTYVDNAANTAAFGRLEDYAVYVSLFKFGSAIALSSQLSDTFDSGDIIAAPDGYDLDGLKARVNAAATPNIAWSQVLHNTAGASTANGWPQKLSDGFGDPCTVYFGADWHLPTAGPGDPRGWYKEGGAPFGASSSTIDWSTFTATGGRWVNPSNPLYANFPEQGIVAGNGFGDQDWHIFLSTGGLRYSDVGNTDKQRTNLQYWTSTTTDSSNGYYLTAGDTSMNPAYNGSRSFGMAVRCVLP